MTSPYDATVQFLRQQLPINQDLDGLPWCSESPESERQSTTQWDWLDDQNAIVVTVNTDGTVYIARGPDSNGRKYCDEP